MVIACIVLRVCHRFFPATNYFIFENATLFIFSLKYYFPWLVKSTSRLELACAWAAAAAERLSGG